MKQKSSDNTSELGESFFKIVQAATENVERLLGKAGVGTSFSTPIDVGDRTIITAAEAYVIGGSGLGIGFGNPAANEPPADEKTSGKESPKPSVAAYGVDGGGGGGGGGISFSRPVAAIVIGQDSVEIKPIIDATKLGLAFLTTLGGMAFLWLRIRRSGRR